MPDDPRVAVQGNDVTENGIAFILDPRSSSVIAVRQALGERTLHIRISTIGCIERDEWRFIPGLETTGIMPINNHRTRIHGTMFIWIESRAQFSPVDKICAHGMTPELEIEADIRTEGLMLVEKVVFAFIENEPVRIVGKTPAR